MRKFIYYLILFVYFSALVYVSSVYQLFAFDSLLAMHIPTGFILLLIPSAILAAVYSKKVSLRPLVKRKFFIVWFLIIYVISVSIFLTFIEKTKDFYSNYHFEKYQKWDTDRIRYDYENSTIRNGRLETVTGITTYYCKDCDYSISFPEHWAVKEERFNDIEQLLILPSDFIEYKNGCRFNIANRQQQKIGEFNQIITHNGIEFSIYREPKKSSSLITETIESSFKINEISYSLLGFCTISEDIGIDKQYMNLIRTIKPVVK